MAAMAGIYAFLVVIDPYDSGRFPSLGLAGIADDNPRTANASRGRDRRFDSAVIGNSTGAILDPARLSGATGTSFVQLTVAGAAVREQLAVLRWFAAHHERIGTIVLVADRLVWCNNDPSLPRNAPFPFWLYGGDAAYLANLLSVDAMRHAFARIGLALGLYAPADPAGYVDNLTRSPRNFHPDLSRLEAARSSPPLPVPVVSLPAIERLAAELRALPVAARVVVVMSPVFAAALPPPDTLSGANEAACKQNWARIMAAQPHAQFLDFMVDDEQTRNPRNFFNADHFYGGLARTIEDRIAAAINGTRIAVSSRAE